MRLNKKLVCAGVLSFLSVSASAAGIKSIFDKDYNVVESSKESTFYVGVSGGKTELKLSGKDFTGSDLTDRKGEGSLAKLTLGYQFNETFSFELGHTQFNEMSFSDKGVFDGTASTASVVGNIPIVYGANLSLKLGTILNNVEFTSPAGTLDDELDDKLFYSGVISYKFKAVDVYIGYEEYHFASDNFSEKLRVKAAVAGINYYF